VECGNGTQAEAGGNRKEKQRKLVIMENTIRVGRAKINELFLEVYLVCS